MISLKKNKEKGNPNYISYLAENIIPLLQTAINLIRFFLKRKKSINHLFSCCQNDFNGGYI